MTPVDIERIFTGWDQPALHSAGASLLGHYRRGDECRLDRVVVVLPGGRASRRLLELLVRDAELSGLRLVPPRLTTVGALPELLYRPGLPLADPILTRRVWALTLRSLDSGLVSQLFPHPPERSDLHGWSILARQVERLYHELSGSLLSFREVAEECRSGQLHDDPLRWEVLDLAANSYLERLSHLGFIDRDRARLDALEGGSVEARFDLWLVGLVDLPRITRAMLERVGVPIRVLIHAPSDLADSFDELGSIRAEPWRDTLIPLDDDQIIIADRPADQATSILTSLRPFAGEFAAEEVTIGVPDPEIVPYIEEELTASAIPVRYATGRPVNRSRPFLLLAAVADYLDGRRFEDLAALARHPDLWAWYERYQGRRLEYDAKLTALDRYFNRALPAELGERIITAAPESQVVHHFRKALEGEALLGRLTGEYLLAEWAPKVLDLLIEIYGPDPIRLWRDDPGHLVVEACRVLHSVAAGFYTLPEGADERSSAATAIRLILAEASDQFLTPEADDGAVELLGWLELHLDDAPALLITGANEPMLPESITADPFLPNSTRTRLGLLDNDRRYARDAYQLTAILNSRPVVRLITGRRDAAGDPLRPSRLLFASAPETIARRASTLFAEPEGEPIRPERPIIEPSTVPGFRLPPEPVIVAPEPITTLRVTDFRLLLSDPYRFALERIRRLRSIDDAARELDPLHFGALAHRILQRFGEGPERAEVDPVRLTRYLDHLLDDEADRRYGRDALPAVYIQLEQLRMRLRAFAEWQAERTEEGWEIAEVELSTPDGGVPFDVDGSPIYLTGRIDRIDHHPGRGEWAIFDYKTGDRPASPESTHRAGPRNDRRWIDLQLPLYLHLLPAIEGEGGRPLIELDDLQRVELGYILLPRELGSVGDAMAEWDSDALEGAAETAREIVRWMRGEGYQFTFGTVRPETWPGDPMAALLGIGQLVMAPEGEES